MNWASQKQTRWQTPPRVCLIAILLIVHATHMLRAQAVGGIAPQSATSQLPAPSGYACDLLQGPDPAANPILKKQRTEYALGSRLAAKAENNADLIRDDRILGYLNRLEQRITSTSQLSGCFIVKVLHDPEPNAYSLPGGFIYLTTGLISLTSSEGEVVAALAHETGHVTARHLTRLDAQTRMWRRLALIGGPAGYAARRYIGPLLTLKLVRNKEYEADQLGMRYEIASGYDPAQFTDLLRDAFSEIEGEDSFVDRLFDTHPSTKTRVERLQRNIRWSAVCATACLVSTSEFEQMKQRLATIMAERTDQ